MLNINNYIKESLVNHKVKTKIIDDETIVIKKSTRYAGYKYFVIVNSLDHFKKISRRNSNYWRRYINIS